MTKKTILFGVIFLMLVGILTAGCGEDKNVAAVRNGTMHMCPGVPVGKAFDQFFEKTSWKSFTSTSNETIVEFVGESEWMGLKAKFTIQFDVKGQNFNLRYLDFNGLPMDTETSIEMVRTILEEYRP